MVVFFVISVTLGLIFNHYYKFRFDQIINLFNVYKFISLQSINQLKEYFSLLSARIILKNKLKDINEL